MKVVRFRLAVAGSIPEVLAPDTLYVTADRDVAGHLCACGCGREVITPISPTDWSISFDRRGASLSPSIGNWAFPCRSHYFIRSGGVVWARDMSNSAIEQGRRRDRARKQQYYELEDKSPSKHPEPTVERATKPPAPVARTDDESFGQRLQAWWRRLLVG